MIQLRILAGPKAGELQFVRRFPFHVGRASDNDLPLDAPGVWNYHFMLNLQPDAGFTLQTFDEAFATVNDQPQTAARLRNGDIISFGAAKIQFWLAARAAPPRTPGLGAARHRDCRANCPHRLVHPMNRLPDNCDRAAAPRFIP